MGGINIWQLLIIAIIVILVFGTKKLSSLGTDLGTSIRGFKKAMSDEDSKLDADFAQQSLPEAHNIAPANGVKHRSQERV